MFHLKEVKVSLVHLLILLTFLPEWHDCLIITSVLAGDKKFKTISFDTKFLKPLTFEKEMPLTEFRRHRTMRPPKFDIDVNIPIRLPLEEEYPQEEKKKPVVSNFFFQTGEIKEPYYGKKQNNYPTMKETYQNELSYAATNNVPSQAVKYGHENRFLDQIPPVNNKQVLDEPNKRSDVKEPQESQQQAMVAQESSGKGYYSGNYAQPAQSYNDYQPEFVPGGFVNLQLSGPTGGPKMTYQDYDREKWAQQLSQAPGAMPYPILNYQQLQNYYGGLGTFTNGLAENRYMHAGLLEKFKSVLTHFSSKLHGLG